MKNTVFYLVLFLSLSYLTSCAPPAQPTNPPPSLKISDLEGVWATHYSLGTTDTIIINSDGTFQQVFEDSHEEYLFDSGWSQWTLEKLPNGTVRLHLHGGRYYLDGISLAETNGRKNPDHPCLEEDCTWGLKPRSFYDPFTDEPVQMVNELILVILVDARGNLILHHIWTSSDRGFLLIDKDREIFYREISKSP
jgi:hypothetical protein